jgi:class 3 adenylate cyclase
MKRVIVRRVRSGRTAAKKARPDASAVPALRILNTAEFKSFNPALLKLGDLNLPSQEREAVTAVFDLTGFTTFCNQVDAYLAIPRFLKEFLDWFFVSVRRRLTAEIRGEKIAVWAELPMKVKFMGDGLMILWNARHLTDAQICRLTLMLYDICKAYRTEFYPHIAETIDRAPRILRCGVARGKVFTVGNGEDFVGHCINNASRLSHLYGLSFAFPNRGFPVRRFLTEDRANVFVPKHVGVRGVGDNELVWVVQREFDFLPAEDKANFRDPETVTARPVAAL